MASLVQDLATKHSERMLKIHAGSHCCQLKGMDVSIT